MRPIVFVLLAIMAVAAGGSAAGSPARPNVLFIVADDQRWDTIAAFGNAEIKTPHLDALAQRGYVFPNTYCMGSMIGAVCAPSRTMLMTGRSLWHIPQPNAQEYAGPTLGGVFRQAGYATLFVGKRGNTFHVGNEAFETLVYDESRGDKLAGRIGASQFMADTALDWLRQQPAGKPFCMYLAPPVPHDPRVAPPEFMQMYDPAKITLSPNFLPEHPFDNGELRIRDELLAPHPRTEADMRRHLAEYYGTISNFDHHVGRVLAAMQERGELERTLVVFTSDQGLAVGGRHGLMGKQNLYEHFRSPLIVAGPGVPPGRRSDALVYLFDLFPTVCDAAGLPVPSECEGRSLMPVVRDEQAAVRDTLFAAYRDCQRMIRDARWKLIKYNAGGVKNVQLFDLAHDPDELKNLANDPAAAAERQRLERALAEARQAWNDPIDFDSDAPRKPRPQPEKPKRKRPR